MSYVEIIFVIWCVMLKVEELVEVIRISVVIQGVIKIYLSKETLKSFRDIEMKRMQTFRQEKCCPKSKVLFLHQAQKQ